MTNHLIDGSWFVQNLINQKSAKIIEYDKYGNVTHICIEDKDYSLSYHDNGNVAYCMYTNNVGSLLYHFDNNGVLTTTTTPMITNNMTYQFSKLRYMMNLK